MNVATEETSVNTALWPYGSTGPEFDEPEPLPTDDPASSLTLAQYGRRLAEQLKNTGPLGEFYATAIMDRVEDLEYLGAKTPEQFEARSEAMKPPLPSRVRKIVQDAYYTLDMIESEWQRAYEEELRGVGCSLRPFYGKPTIESLKWLLEAPKSPQAQDVAQ